MDLNRSLKRSDAPTSQESDRLSEFSCENIGTPDFSGYEDDGIWILHLQNARSLRQFLDLAVAQNVSSLNLFHQAIARTLVHFPVDSTASTTET